MWPLASRIIDKDFSDILYLKDGIFMKTDLSDILGRVLLFYGPVSKYIWEPQTTRLAELLVKDAQNALVAGAHLGYMALMIRRAMPREATVYTFEPIPYLYDIARENAVLNRKDIGEVIVYNKALSNVSRKASMTLDSIRSKMDDSDEGEHIRVETVSVDQLITGGSINYPDFVLLDVEGHELIVLKGMHDTLMKNPPKNIIFEVSPRIAGGEPDVETITSILKPYGYAFYHIEDDYKCRHVGRIKLPVVLYPLEPRLLSEARYFNVLATIETSSMLEDKDIVLRR